jgi:hypothetical protein
MLKVIVLLLAALVAAPSFAAPESQTLSACFADNTTGKDRKILARWVFLGMSTHPEMQDITHVAPDVIDNATKVTAALFTRLTTQSCRNEFRAATLSSGGSSEIQAAFQVLGQLAMQELMTDKNVMTSMSAISKYIDKKALLEALKR